MLIFNPEEHTYTLDGVPLPSITQVMAPLNDFSRIQAHILEAKADYGHRVHQAISLDIVGMLDEVDEDIQPALGFFRQWKAENPKYAERLGDAIVETPMADGKLGYAGTPDIILDGLAVIEIKTTYSLDKLACGIQCAAQENLHVVGGGKPKKEDSPYFYEHWVLHLKKDGYKFVDVKNFFAWERFLFLLDHHNVQNTIKSWRAKK